MQFDDPTGGDDIWEVDESLPLFPAASARGWTYRTLVDVAARLTTAYRDAIDLAYRESPSYPARVCLGVMLGTPDDPDEPRDFAEAMSWEDAAERDLPALRAKAIPLTPSGQDDEAPPGRFEIAVAAPGAGCVSCYRKVPNPVAPD